MSVTGNVIGMYVPTDSTLSQPNIPADAKTVGDELRALAEGGMSDAHIEDKNNPHEVTIEQIGAAAAGYGLGETFARAADNADEIERSGWYASNVGVPDTNWWTILAIVNDSTTQFQIAYRQHDGCRMERSKVNGAWGEWENYSLSEFAPASHVSNQNNPHGVTVAQIGAAPSSHVSDKNNPHGVTLAQVGAAAATHNHSAAEITSGTLAVARGGTGATTAAAARTSLEAQHQISTGTANPSGGSNGDVYIQTGNVASLIGAATTSDLANYLPKTGGELSSNNAEVLSFNSTTGSDTYMPIKVNGTKKASIGYVSGFACLTNTTKPARLGVNDSGTPQYWSSGDVSSAKELLHAGNVTTYAAPAGYGLGANSPKIETSAALDAVSGCGFVGLATNIIAPTKGGWGYTVLNENGTYGTQVVYSIDGWELQRTKASGAWGEWEWVTPPLVAGTEYRTTKRWDGKVVYAKLVNIGDTPAVGASKTVEVAPSGSTIINVSATGISSDNLVCRLFPIYDNSGTLQASIRVTDQIKLTVTAHKWSFTSAYKVYAYVEYTKA